MCSPRPSKLTCVRAPAVSSRDVLANISSPVLAVLSQPVRLEEKAQAAPAGDLTGSWDVRIEYAAGVPSHQLHLRQRGNDVAGTHQGDFVSRDLRGTIDGDAVRLHSRYSHADELRYTFSGTLKGDEMAGELDLGEYLGARFSARRHVQAGA